MTNGAKWSIGIGLLLLEVALVVLGWNWLQQPAATTGGSVFTLPFGEKTPRLLWGAETVDVDEAIDLYCDGAVFIDVQSKANFAASSVPHAEWMDYPRGFSRSALARHAGPGDKIVLYCESDRCWNAYHAAKKLVGWDMPNIYFFRDGINGWNADRLKVQMATQSGDCSSDGGWAPSSRFSGMSSGFNK